ncbi:MAG TPA: alpha/beta hydrolase [Candidatus Dormibacteraeota bacterium]|nr:alpha/beta hydrolase [Candidatus Dormibacteraeota bacterium]
MNSKVARSASLSGSVRKQLQKTADGRTYEDGVLKLRDGRELAWRWWGDPDGTPILRIQGTPGSRKQHNPNPNVQREVGARYLMADRAGYGGSTRKPGRGIADIADDYVELLDAFGLDRVPATGTSGGGPHVLALAAKHPERVSAISVVVGGTPLEADEVKHLVGVNAKGYALAEQGWQPLYEFLVEVRKRLLSDEGMQGVLSDAPEPDRVIMADPAWQKMSRENTAEAMRQGAEGWTDESLAMHHRWDFDPANVRTSVTWWHGDDDKNAPLSAARRVVAKIPKVNLRTWHNEGHFVSLTHEKEILQELLSRSR